MCLIIQVELYLCISTYFITPTILFSMVILEYLLAVHTLSVALKDNALSSKFSALEKLFARKASIFVRLYEGT